MSVSMRLHKEQNLWAIVSWFGHTLRIHNSATICSPVKWQNNNYNLIHLFKASNKLMNGRFSKHVWHKVTVQASVLITACSLDSRERSFDLCKLKVESALFVCSGDTLVYTVTVTVLSSSFGNVVEVRRLAAPTL